MHMSLNEEILQCLDRIDAENRVLDELLTENFASNLSEKQAGTKVKQIRVFLDRCRGEFKAGVIELGVRTPIA